MDSQETIKSFYQKDHDRLDSLFQEFCRLKLTNFSEARTYFREFNHGLLRHIRWEEEILFPLFESKTGMKNSGPTEVMRFEHTQIKKNLQDIHDKIRAGEAGDDDSEAMLLEVLTQHNAKEEGILYPAIDSFLQLETRDQVFKQMEEISIEKQNSCCGLHS